MDRTSPFDSGLPMPPMDPNFEPNHWTNQLKQSYSEILAEFHDGDDDDSAIDCPVENFTTMADGTNSCNFDAIVPPGAAGESSTQFFLPPVFTPPIAPVPVETPASFYSNPSSEAPSRFSSPSSILSSPVNYQQPPRISRAPEPLNYAMVVKKQVPNAPISFAAAAAAASNKCVAQPKQENFASKVAASSGPPTPSSTVENNKENLNAAAANGSKTFKGQNVVNGVELSKLKFVKPAPQCPNWDKPKHRLDTPHCPFWHPRVICSYYPNCQLTAEVCGYAHPFCGEFCECDPKRRSLQKNHRSKPKTQQKTEEVQQQKKGKTTQQQPAKKSTKDGRS